MTKREGNDGGFRKELTEDETEARLVASIAAINAALAGSAENTAAMVDALAAFETRVDELDNAVRPIKDLTERLEVAQKNINKTLVEFEKIHSHFETVENARRLLSDTTKLQSAEKSDRVLYFKTVEKLCSAHLYFMKKREFASGPEALRDAERLQTVAVNAMCKQFEGSLEQYAANSKSYLTSREKGGGDVLKSHQSFPLESSERTRELATCLDQCGLSDHFVNYYTNSRGKVLINVFEELAEKDTPEEATDPLLPVDRGTVESGTASEAGSSAGKSSRVGNSIANAFASFSASRSIQSGESLSGKNDYFDDSDAESVSSSMTQKKSGKWGSRFKRVKAVFKKSKGKGLDDSEFPEPSIQLRRTTNAAPANLPPLPSFQGSRTANAPQASMPPLAPASFHLTVQPPPTESPKSLKGSKSMQRFRSSLGKNEMVAFHFQVIHYKTGEHEMLRLLDIAEYMFRAEMILSVKVLPQGRKGRRIFLDAMVAPCETLTSIGMKVALPRTKRYTEADRVFASIDVLEKMWRVRGGLEEVLDPESFTYLDYESRTGSGEDEPSKATNRKGLGSPRGSSPRSAPLPRSAWNQILLLFSSWRSFALANLNDARSMLLQPITVLPPTASVHPLTTLLIQYIRRMYSSYPVVQQLVEGQDGIEYTSEFIQLTAGVDGKPNPIGVRRSFQEYVAGIINQYCELLFAVEQAKTGSSMTTVLLFILNNIHYLVETIERDESLLPVLGPTSSFTHRRSDIVTMKNRLLEEILPPILNLVGENEPEGVDLPSMAGIAPNPIGKKILKDYCSRIKNWVDTTFSELARIEVPDFELRTELRYLIRSAIMPRYELRFNQLSQIPFTKNVDKHLPHSPEELSTIISQYFEISETTSNPSALYTPSTPSSSNKRMSRGG